MYIDAAYCCRPSNVATLAKNWGLCPFFGRDLGPHHTHCGLGRGLPHTKWYLDPSSCLATIDMGGRVGAAVPHFLGAALPPFNTM